MKIFDKQQIKVNNRMLTSELSSDKISYNNQEFKT